jgi:hypothetical protein
MQDFSKFNKKEEFVILPVTNFEIGKKIRLVANLSVYEPGEVFTVVNESTPTFSTTTWGIGETYLKDNNGSILLIKGNKKFISEVFENVQELIPAPVVVEEKKQDIVPFLIEDIKRSLKQELVKQLKEEIKPIQGPKGDKGDRGMPGMSGDKGDVGERGETGWTGWPGDKGEMGIQGEKGERGDKGDQGERGEKGDRGEPGSKGDKGEKGDAGEKGEKGDKGDRGDRGDVGLQGERGEQGEQGERGEDGERGEKGDRGDTGLSGKDGKDGIAGEKGEKGDKGDTGERGEKGDKGDTGDSGIVSVSYPLAYEDVSKHLSLDVKYLEEFNNKVTSEISKVAYGSGGGGNVDLYIDGEKAVKNLRSINFTGDGVTVTPDGIKATVNISAVAGPAGPQGPAGQSTGKVLYLNYSESSDVSPYKILSENLTTTTEQTLNKSLPTFNGNGYSTESVENFITSVGVPNQTKLDPGLWDVTLYANVDSDTGGRECYLFTRLYKRTSAGIETQIAQSDNSEKLTTTLTDYSFEIVILQPVILNSTDRLFLEIYAVHRGNSHQITLKFEGTSHYAHVHTTILQTSLQPSDYVKNLSLNTNGNLIVTYGDNTSDDLGDVLDVDGGTF